MKRLSLLMVLLVLTLSGCAEKGPTIQIMGQPVSDFVISASVFQSNLNMRYQLVRSFKVYEGKEFYESVEYLSLTKQGCYVLREGEELTLGVTIYNPFKEQFQIIKHFKIVGGIEFKEKMYEGNLTRKQISMVMPSSKEPTDCWFEVLGSTGKTVYRSFEAQYQYATNTGG